MSFKIKFWGVRGSIACPSSKYVMYGGNTSCVEVACGGTRVILDAGTGMRNLGHWLMRKHNQHIHILMSHTHWDHINGFPFFAPAFRENRSFTIMAGHMHDKDMGIRDIFEGQMTQPTFPVPLDAMKAKLEFEDFAAGDNFNIDQTIKVSTTGLNHPDNATGYRFEFKNKIFCYVTDTEHVPGTLDENILALIEGADVVAYDCTYTDREFVSRAGWGHSTWQEGVRLCRAAKAKKLAIFHHDPDHEDMFMQNLEAEARSEWAGTFVARENMQLQLVP